MDPLCVISYDSQEADTVLQVKKWRPHMPGSNQENRGARVAAEISLHLGPVQA